MFEEMLQNGAVPAPDLVVTPGDLGDRAELAGLNFAWSFLSRITAHSSKKLLIATAGNHDVDSRYNNSTFDAKGFLLSLTPSYPRISDEIKHYDGLLSLPQMMFWSQNFFVERVGDYRFVVLNSSAYHGMGKNNGEFEHGRVSNYTLDQLRRYLRLEDESFDKQQIPPIKLNILLCHHHLIQDGTAEDKDYSLLVGAHALVEFLSSNDFGRWFVIHGHRHRARLLQAGGAGGGPYVLSAGSFGATRDKDYENTSPNQAHLIELDAESMHRLAYYPAGKIRSWTWQQGVGWLNDKVGTGGLPPLTGFGFRGSIDSVASQVAAAIQEFPGKWEHLCQKYEQLRFLDYRQIDDLKKTLKRNHTVNIIMADNGLPLEVGKP
jgi:hypothetical protein